jgi:hypothetical protein
MTEQRSVERLRSAQCFTDAKDDHRAGCVLPTEPQRLRSAPFMKEPLMTNLRRRDLLRLAIAGAGATALSTVVPEPAAAKPVDLNEKRKARYRADSAEVQDFYRVNSYPAR